MADKGNNAQMAIKPTSPKYRLSSLKTHLVSPGTGCLRNMAGKKKVFHRHGLINGNHAQCIRNAGHINVNSKSQKRKGFFASKLIDTGLQNFSHVLGSLAVFK